MLTSLPSGITELTQLESIKHDYTVRGHDGHSNKITVLKARIKAIENQKQRHKDERLQ